MAVLVAPKCCVGPNKTRFMDHLNWKKKKYFENAQIRIENPSKFENDRRLTEQQLKLNLFTGSLIMNTTSCKTIQIFYTGWKGCALRLEKIRWMEQVDHLNYSFMHTKLAWEPSFAWIFSISLHYQAKNICLVLTSSPIKYLGSWVQELYSDKQTNEWDY